MATGQKPGDTVRLLDLHPPADDFAQDVLDGLLAEDKHLSPKYFYDLRGSRLFDRITELPEYYPTRAELEIMRTSIDEIAAQVGPAACVIEFGSGSGLKTRRLLAGLEDPAAYVPVDISRDHLMAAAEAIAEDFPEIQVLPVCADFTRPFELPQPDRQPARNLVYFPGSTIGNFAGDEAGQLLRVMHAEAGPAGALLIGVDLRKDTEVLKNAYNDEAGVTAEFNLNLLRRINRELDADFDLKRFRHEADWDEEEGRIEMRLVSLTRQSVTVAGKRVSFREGEDILTEYSHKYGIKEFAGLAARAGFTVEAMWKDPRELFSVQLLVRG